MLNSGEDVAEETRNKVLGRNAGPREPHLWTLAAGLGPEEKEGPEEEGGRPVVSVGLRSVPLLIRKSTKNISWTFEFEYHNIMHQTPWQVEKKDQEEDEEEDNEGEDDEEDENDEDNEDEEDGNEGEEQEEEEEEENNEDEDDDDEQDEEEEEEPKGKKRKASGKAKAKAKGKAKAKPKAKGKAKGKGKSKGRPKVPRFNFNRSICMSKLFIFDSDSRLEPRKHRMSWTSWRTWCHEQVGGHDVTLGPRSTEPCENVSHALFNFETKNPNYFEPQLLWLSTLILFIFWVWLRSGLTRSCLIRGKILTSVTHCQSKIQMRSIFNSTLQISSFSSKVL